MELGLSDKVVLVTGASKGLGAAIALAFGEEKSKLVLVARTQSELEQVAADATEKGAAEVLAIAKLMKLNELFLRQFSNLAQSMC
ncbi:SDR family NAD(P)-dependent oxidoreductase [Phormidium sp. LEGE 05292]|uniref:SDR family NAD(P)-dependent oxidoreductase n=1 Tax=[Phormidium] sp. LEGE 05292 TaxID=767427 RepID=UPI00187EEFBB|nr:SDR family NAD(P)-dependent oxidoreductase [Phormidium sp. LEGE 05292]